MKTGIVSIFMLLLIPGFAHAERWILKNPSASMRASALKSFDLNGQNYAVVEAPSNAMRALRAGAELVMPDLEISLPETRSNEAPAAGKAWHVDEMKYSQLPIQKDGQGLIVAVLDTGIDYKHPALAQHIWKNAGEIAGNGIDDDGNGYVDDIMGYDFEAGDADPMDQMGHGTHCAGIIAGDLEPITGAMGVAQGVKLMPVRIIGYKTKGFLSDAVAGIQYAVNNGAMVMSNSWRVYKSWTQYDPNEGAVKLLKEAIQYAEGKGAIFVAAAGNERRNIDTDPDLMYPGGFEGLTNLLVVAASNISNSPASFTNFGSGHVQVAAPGDNIISTYPNGKWISMSGTSMATPLVAGVIARALSAGFSYQLAMEKIETTSSPFSTWDTKVKAAGVIHPLNFLGP